LHEVDELLGDLLVDRGAAVDHAEQEPARPVDAEVADGALAALDGDLAGQLDAERALALLQRGGRALDLGADLLPQPGRLGGGEGLELRRAVVVQHDDTDVRVADGGEADVEGRVVGQAHAAQVDPVVVGVGLVGVPRPMLTHRCRRGRLGDRLLGLLTTATTSEHCVSLSLSQRPVEPWPPVPRTDAGSSPTSRKTGRSTRWKTSWAMRSPRRSRKGSFASVLIKVTLISPR